MEKKEKLEKVLTKLVSAVVPAELKFTFFFDDAISKFKDYCFVDVGSRENVRPVIKALNNYQFDKNHQLKLNPITDIPLYSATPDTLDLDAVVPPYREKDHLKHWLLDSRDLFACLHGNTAQMYFHSSSLAPELVHERKNWTESSIRWSPQGSFRFFGQAD